MPLGRCLARRVFGVAVARRLVGVARGCFADAALGVAMSRVMLSGLPLGGGKVAHPKGVTDEGRCGGAYAARQMPRSPVGGRCRGCGAGVMARSDDR